MYRCLDVPCGPLQGKLRVSRGEFHRAQVLAGVATPRGPCAAELRVSLRGFAAVPCRKLGAARRANVARLQSWHNGRGASDFFVTSILAYLNISVQRKKDDPGVSFYRFLAVSPGHCGHCNFGLLACQARGWGGDGTWW